jgi:1-acyl-sn-glycerol-3-phosphate acyltransferase
MQTQPSSPPKPITEVWKPELVALPRLTLARRIMRPVLLYLIKALAFFTLRITARGLENVPKKGPAILVINHLGDADVVLVGAVLGTYPDAMGKIELNDHWLVGPIFRAYGIIWVHRGRPDRRALRAALEGLAQGRILALAPEGRQSTTGGLEEGTEGAAFLAMKSGAPIVPLAMTGTDNENVYGNLRRFKRTAVTISAGKPFFIREQADRQDMIREGTRQIMGSLAELLPESYQGNYKGVHEEERR